MNGFSNKHFDLPTPNEMFYDVNQQIITDYKNNSFINEEESLKN